LSPCFNQSAAWHRTALRTRPFAAELAHEHARATVGPARQAPCL
jgi:hypothetical protein